MRKALLPIVVLPLMLFCRSPRHADAETGEHDGVAGAPEGVQAASPEQPCAPEPEDWDARWIVEPQAAESSTPNSWFCFRTRGTLRARPHLARARIAADSKYWLWINGRLIVFEGALKRGPTPHDTYYDEIPLRDHLVRGENTIAILLWFFGKDGFSHKSSGMPGLLFQAEIDDTTLVSDRTWRAMRHPSYSDTEAPHPNYRLSESNVRFDARSDMPSWTGIDFDDSAWPQAAEAGRPPTPPWNLLIPRPTPLWEFSEIRDYVNENEFPRFSDGERIAARLPHNMAVTPYVEVDAREGQVIRLRTDSYGHHDKSFNIRAEYITRPGLQQYEALAYMTGHEVYYPGYFTRES
ncbi:alpha-L-rhamnosidase N-terminal domain-containing protein [Candidatus Fermentibacteria bacterium]|nr:alpha-L-rhamnosidase N-terminal domain-containing protein [Candidatus Fermentibacteria bacterium]